MPEGKIRAFIAIELPKEAKLFLANIQETLKKSDTDVKWVEPDNIHLTLKFLGERDNKKINEVIKAMEEAVRFSAPFQTQIYGVGVFPKKDYPRVVWVGLAKGKENILKLAGDLDNQICKAGIPKETKAFSSHITLGRVRSPLDKKQLIEKIEYLEGNFPADPPLFNVDKITLFKSTLTPKGPVYEALKVAHLKAN